VDVLGIDMGVVNLAVDSDGATFSGDGVEEVRRRYGKRRKLLNQCGTKSARRRLRKIRKKEARYRANQNHIIAKRCVQKAKDTRSALAVEDLEGINQRTRATTRKAQRNRRFGWPVYQLRTFLEYKALAVGVPVIAVDPAYTSQTCPECDHCHKGNRKTRDLFVCSKCHYQAPADLVGARNVRKIGHSQLSERFLAEPGAGVGDSGLVPRKRLPAKPPDLSVGSI
jgi:IS605 OrfB family transposase